MKKHEIKLKNFSRCFINPHILGLGNYDVNVLMLALESQSMTAVWFDKRKEVTSSSLELHRSFGFILNVPSDYSFGFVTLPLVKSRHWISIRRMSDDQYYNLDSKLSKPQRIGDHEEVVNYFKKEMKSNDKELFLVFPKDSS